MVQLSISENRNTDPVRFFRNRVRIFLGQDLQYPFWVDESSLFSLLNDDQKRTYLMEKRGKVLILSIGPKEARKIVEIGDTKQSKSMILRELL